MRKTREGRQLFLVRSDNPEFPLVKDSMSFFDFSSVLETTKCLGPQICRQISYVKNLERNFTTLEKMAHVLEGNKKDIEYEIRRRRNKKVTNDCQIWLEKVEEIGTKMLEVSHTFEEMDKRCLKRWCLNIHSFWKLSRMIVQTTKNMLDLTNKKPSEFLVDELPPDVEKVPVIPINKGTSTYHSLKNILELIEDEKIHKVGICGMSGIGKTTMMKNLHNSSEIEGMFDIVIWITIGKYLNIRNMQNEIARRLSIQLSDNDQPNESRAGVLLSELSCKKFMLLIDDVWNKIDFYDIGIPCHNQGNGSKVVLTTTYLDVCRKMETDVEIMVDLLSEDESWKLFHEKVGDVVDFHYIQPLAKLIVKECGGLPLAINVVGGSLRKIEEVQIWEDALHKLSHPEKKRNIKDEMEEKVYDHLEFSVNRLESQSLKNCFLYMALYPEDFEINIFQLIEYWRIEGFLDSTSGLVEARNEGHAFLRRLVDSSLLIKWGTYVVKMHDLLRDLAFKIISRLDSSDKFLVIIGEKTSLEKDQWMRATRISIMHNYRRILQLDQPINCPSLKTLIFKSFGLKVINHGFFVHMESLMVLDLSGTGIEFLPPSIASLVSLVGLYLRMCNKLLTLPIEIGHLKMLEVLDLCWTVLYVFPLEVRQLTRLRVLQVGLDVHDDIGMDGVMKIGIISRLQKLEHLRIEVKEYAIKSKWDNHAKLVNEVCSLNELTCFAFTFKNVEYLKHFIQTSRRYQIGAIKVFNWSIGGMVYGSYWPIERGVSMASVIDDNIIDIPWELLPPPNELSITRDKNITSLSESSFQNLNNLTQCSLRECVAMEIVMRGVEISISNVDGQMIFPILETLNLGGMKNLRAIWDGHFPKGSFAYLKRLHLTACQNLKRVLSYEICQHLSNLEYIAILLCSKLEEVIYVDQFHESCVLPVLLPKLKKLQLIGLPELVVILGGDFLPKWPSLEYIEVIHQCSKLKKLPLGLSNAPKLRNIVCSREWWDELIWSDEAIKLKMSHIRSDHFWATPREFDSD